MRGRVATAVTMPKCPLVVVSLFSLSASPLGALSNFRTCLRRMDVFFLLADAAADAVTVNKLPCSSPKTRDSDSGATPKHEIDPPGTWMDSTGSLKFDMDQKFNRPSRELVTKPACVEAEFRGIKL